MEQPTDCLVLMIQEKERKSDLIDNILFILYDTQLEKYIIRGKRNIFDGGSKYNFFPYSFTCKKKKDVFEFINFSICSSNKISIDLMNYDNLPYESNDITFDFLIDNVDRNYEISAYDNVKINNKKRGYFHKKNMIKILRIIKNVANEY
jgi:hypothetical protein